MSDALAFIEKYADDTFDFSHFYKFSFTYVHTENSEIAVTVGGSHDAIYRADMIGRMPLCKIITEAGGEYAFAVIADTQIDLEDADVFALAYARVKARTLAAAGLTGGQGDE